MQGDRGTMHVHVQRCKPKKIKILLGLKNKLVKAEHCQFNHKNNINVAFAHVCSHDWQGGNKLCKICKSLRCPDHSLKIWDWKIMWMILDSERERRAVHIRSKVPESHNFQGSIPHPSMTTSCEDICACLGEVSISTKCLLKGSTISVELYIDWCLLSMRAMRYKDVYSVQNRSFSNLQIGVHFSSFFLIFLFF